MYTKQEVSKQKQAFWTAMGQYMQPILSADGEKINWVNYKTGIAGISFKMDADQQQASIAIVLSHKDFNDQQSCYNQLGQLKPILEEALGEPWLWQPSIPDDYGKTISSIGIHITGVSISRVENWPAIISFLKPRIIALDEFWSTVRDGF